MAYNNRARMSAVALAAVVSLVGLTACGAGSRAGAESAASVECEYTTPAEATTVNVLAYNSTAIDPFTNTMVKSCTRDKVTLKHDPIDFGGQVTKTTTTLAGETGSYDILETYSFVTAGMAAKGDIEPLDDYVAKYADKYKLDEISKEMRSGLSYDGKLYGLPMQAQMYILAYRKDVFDSLGLQPPTTYAGMIDAAKAIKAKGEIKYPIALPWNATADIATSYQAAMNSGGVDFLDSSGKPQFSSAASKKALEEMTSLIPYMDPQVTTFDQPKVQQQMFNGTAAMTVMFSGRMNDLTMPTNSKLADQFAFAAAPAVESDSPYLYSRLSVDGWAIPKNTKLDKDLLFQMMAASVGEDASKASVPAAYPAREGMVSEDSSKYASAANATIKKTMPAPGHPLNAPVTNAIRPALVQILTGKVDIDKGMTQMQDLAEKAIAAN